MARKPDAEGEYRTFLLHVDDDPVGLRLRAADEDDAERLLVVASRRLGFSADGIELQPVNE